MASSAAVQSRPLVANGQTAAAAQQAQQPGPHLSPLWAQLIKEQGEQQAASDGAAEGHVFFVGPRNAGKSALMGRVLDAAAGQGSGGSSNTSSSSCVSYAYVRPTNSSGSRDHAVAHFWELSSGDTSGSFSQDVAAARALLDADRLFVTPKTVATACVVLALDLAAADPAQLGATADAWLGAVRAKLAATYAAYERRGLAAVPQQLKQRERAAVWAKHEDAAAVDVLGVPIIIVGTRWDALSAQSADRQLAVAAAMRSVAHTHGAHLAFVSCAAPSDSGGGLPLTSSAPQQQKQQQRPSSDGSNTLDATVNLIINIAFKGLERATRKLKQQQQQRFPPRLDPLTDGALFVPAGADRLRALSAFTARLGGSSSDGSAQPAAAAKDGSSGAAGVAAAVSLLADPRYAEPSVDAAVAAAGGAEWWKQLHQLVKQQ